MYELDGIVETHRIFTLRVSFKLRYAQYAHTYAHYTHTKRGTIYFQRFVLKAGNTHICGRSVYRYKS